MPNSFLDVAKKYRSKPVSWWLRVPLYASRYSRHLLRSQMRVLAYRSKTVRRITGLQVPAPPSVKRAIVRVFATNYRLGVFVETGTYLGDTTAELAEVVRRVYSIELSPTLFAQAQARFAGHDNVVLKCGDSGEVLPALLQELTEPCLFWLDGHFSGGETARGASDTPIGIELEAIIRRAQADPDGVGRSVILIDDARDFGRGAYPPIASLRALIDKAIPDASFTVDADIIRIVLAPRPLEVQ